MSIIRIHSLKNSNGFTLLEVMIALVIFSIGLLGLAGIQAVSIQNNNTAYMRTIAMQHAYNIADLIRVSTTNDGSVHTNFDAVTTTVGSAPASCVQKGVSVPNCTDADMSAFDIYHWKNRLQNELPSGRGKITKTGDVYEIIIMWDETHSGVTGEACSGTSTVDLKCYTIHIQS